MARRIPHPYAKSLLLPWAAMLAAFAIVGCSNPNGGDGRGFLGGEAGVVLPCPMTSPDCPESGAPPTYTDDVAPILASHCIGCHGPGGENQDVPLTSYAALIKKSGTDQVGVTAISDVRNCKMPPAPLPGVTEQELNTLLCWLKAKMPQ